MSKALNSEQIKQLASQKITFEVSVYEMAFIIELRKHSFGRVTAVITDGVPQRFEVNQSSMVADSEAFEEIVKNLEKEVSNDKPKWSKAQ